VGDQPDTNGFVGHYDGKAMVSGSLILAQNAGSIGTYDLMGGTLSAGSIQVNEGGTFKVTGVGATPLETTVTGDVTNNGTVKITNADVTWEGTFTNNGVYNSDPSKQTFDDFIVESEGCVLASQDTFVIKNNFENHSTRSGDWNTTEATLQFVAGTDNDHDFYIPGENLGPNGNFHNFAWGTLVIGEPGEPGEPGGEVQTVHLYDGNPNNDGSALYVGKIIGLDIDYDNLIITNIFGAEGLSLYYDPLLNEDWLQGRTYTLNGGGQLTPTPVPPSVLLLGSGLLGLGFLGRQRRKLTKTTR